MRMLFANYTMGLEEDTSLVKTEANSLHALTLAQGDKISITWCLNPRVYSLIENSKECNNKSCVIITYRMVLV